VLYCGQLMRNYKTLLTLALFPLMATAATDHVNIRPGLWETTAKTDTSGAPPISAEQKAQMDAAMAKMSPEMRAKIEAAQKSSQANRAAPHVNRSCVTKEDLEKPFAFDSGNDDGKCTKTVVKATSTVQDIHVECALGKHTSKGDVHMEAQSPEAFTGTVDTTVSDTQGTIKMRTTMSGKWLSSDCGDVKPHTSRKVDKKK